MKLFLLSQDNNIWSVVENGNFVATTTSIKITPSVLKSQTEWNKDENDKVFLNSKAHLFYHVP